VISMTLRSTAVTRRGSHSQPAGRHTLVVDLDLEDFGQASPRRNQLVLLPAAPENDDISALTPARSAAAAWVRRTQADGKDLPAFDWHRSPRVFVVQRRPDREITPLLRGLPHDGPVWRRAHSQCAPCAGAR
jgi:hypothetical protein